MLVSDIKWKFTKQNKKAFTPKLCTWKLKDQDVVSKFQYELNNLLQSDGNLILESVEGILRSTCLKLLDCPVVFPENAISRHDGGGIVQITIQ